MVRIHGLQKLTLQDFPSIPACIVFLAGCNMRCVFCHNPAAVQGTENLSQKEFFEFLESRKRKIKGVVVSGGEPTIYSDLPKFISQIKSMGFQVKLDTNGWNTKMVSDLISKKLVDYIAMDVKAPFKKLHKLIQVKGLETGIKKTIKLVMNSGIDYEFRTTCHPSLTRKDFQTISKQIKGAKRYFLQKYIDDRTLDAQKHLAVYDFLALKELTNEFKENVQEISVR